MTIAPEFQGVTQEDAEKAFRDKFAELRKIHLEEGALPTSETDKELLELFKRVHPIHSDYIQSVFSDSIALAKSFGESVTLPDTDILDVTKEPFAGMGHGIFLRLVYLQNLAVKAMIETESKIHIETPLVLPTLKLLMASDIFNALRIEASNHLIKSAPPKQGGLKAGLLSLLKRDYGDAAQQQIQNGYVMDTSTTGLVSGGTRKVATLLFQDMKVGKNESRLIIDGPEKSDIKAGDFIGTIGLKKSGDNQLSASRMAVLVPRRINAFLRKAEPDFTPIPETVRELIITSTDPNNPEFKYGEALSNENQGTLIFGIIEGVDSRARTFTIKDKNNHFETIKADLPLDNFGLKKGDVFIARPIQLGKDGLYKITPKETMKIEAPYAGRLISGLPQITNKPAEFFDTSAFPETTPIPL